MSRWAATLATACAAAGAHAQDDPVVFPIVASAELSVGSGFVGSLGSILLTQTDADTLEISYSLAGLEAGSHGFHVHGSADFSDGCASTGKHYNPHGMTHGGPQAATRHVGDLGNVVAGDDGVAAGTLVDTVAKLYGPTSILGRAMVVHAGEDDLGLGGHDDSLTTGHAGGRLACGEVMPFEIIDSEGGGGHPKKELVAHAKKQLPLGAADLEVAPKVARDDEAASPKPVKVELRRLAMGGVAAVSVTGIVATVGGAFGLL